MNAKELILKKINADQTWSDIYTASLIFGEDLEELGQLMIDRQELIENYQKSLFSDQQSYGIVSYLSRNKDTTLLEKAQVASEIKILGKILKINQGLPTNIVDFTSYVKSIEEFISQKFDKNFDLIKFLSDDQYREICINVYEKKKDAVNILEVISEVPHFREMLQSIVLNQKILSSLSVRNALFFRLSTNAEKSGLKEIWNELDEKLINQWIYSSNISITIPANALKNPVEYPLTLRESKDLDKFREYMETYIIPQLKLHPKTKDNLFIKNLVLGMKKGTPFYKLNLDMIHIDTTEKTQKLYDSILSDFNKLNTSRISGVPMNLIDAFYLYNLIVNKDKFGPNNLTRVFEDILVQPGNENLFIHKFNSWIDIQNVDELYVKLYPEFKEFEQKQKPNSKSVEKSSETEPLEYQHLSSTPEIIGPVNQTVQKEKEINGMHFAENDEPIESQLSIPSNTDIINETETIGIPVDVTLPGQPKRTYLVTPDEKIYNSDGAEVFATPSKNRNKILANYAVQQKIAVVVIDKTGKFVVYKDGKIISVKSGDIVYEDPTHGIRKRLLVAANKQFVNNEVYDTSVPKKTELIEKLKYLQLPNVKMVTDRELMEQPWYIRNAFGFIENGVIHINVNRAADTTVIHEFGHIYLGHARTHNSEQYYNLLKQVRDTQLYKELRNRPEYANKQGSDYDEEILAIMLEEYFSNPNDENIIVEQLLQILNPEFVNFMNTGIVPRLNDSLIAEYAISQKVATAKNKLIKDNQLIENCE